MRQSHDTVRRLMKAEVEQQSKVSNLHFSGSIFGVNFNALGGMIDSNLI